MPAVTAAEPTGEVVDLTDSGEGLAVQVPPFSDYATATPSDNEPFDPLLSADAPNDETWVAGAVAFGTATVRVGSRAPKGPSPVVIGGLLVLGAAALLGESERPVEIEFGAKERERQRLEDAYRFVRQEQTKPDTKVEPLPDTTPTAPWTVWFPLLPIAPAAPIEWQSPCTTPPCVGAPVPTKPARPGSIPQTAPKPAARPTLPKPVPAMASDKPTAPPPPPAQQPPSPAPAAPAPVQTSKSDPAPKARKVRPPVPAPTTKEEQSYYRALDAFRGHGNGKPLSASELEAARERRELEFERLIREREKAARRGDRIRANAITQELREQRGFPRWVRHAAQRAREAEQRRPDAELDALGVRGLRSEANRARMARSRATYRYTRTGNSEDLQAELAARQYANAVNQRLRTRLNPPEPHEVSARAAVEAAARGEQDLSQRFSFDVLRRARRLARRDYNTAYQAEREEALAQARRARRQLGTALREHRDYPLWQRLRHSVDAGTATDDTPYLKPVEQMSRRELRTERRYAQRQFDLWRRRAQRHPEDQGNRERAESARSYRNLVAELLERPPAGTPARTAYDRARRLMAGDTSELNGLGLEQLLRVRRYVRLDMRNTQHAVDTARPETGAEYLRKLELQGELTERLAAVKRNTEVASRGTAALEAERIARRLLKGDATALAGASRETLELVRDRVADQVNNARKSVAREAPGARQRFDSRHAAFERVAAAIEEAKRTARLVTEKDLTAMPVPQLESELTEAEKALNRTKARYYYNLRQGNTPDGREDMERARAYRDRVKAELTAARRDPTRNAPWSELTPPTDGLEPKPE